MCYSFTCCNLVYRVYSFLLFQRAQLVLFPSWNLSALLFFNRLCSSSWSCFNVHLCPFAAFFLLIRHKFYFPRMSSVLLVVSFFPSSPYGPVPHSTHRSFISRSPLSQLLRIIFAFSRHIPPPALSLHQSDSSILSSLTSLPFPSVVLPPFFPTSVRL